MTPCFCCGEPGREGVVIYQVLANRIELPICLCAACKSRVRDCRRFLVSREAGGWSVCAIDAENRPLLRRQE